ncbi:Glycolipid transfer protein [Mycena sanguinolenta]|uniref:Glycolipid transfer protein n=1 Tax=Mycena sanguinolenta TaxID=230812 RepID=A0A8H6ZKX0_9AGAR|nr:Glycolipid transfer protein [Mycena sanguinolenta]
MTPYFETAKSFADVQITDAGVNTEEFLLASDGLVALFGEFLRVRANAKLKVPDLLGSGVFGFVQADIKSNISGLRERYNAARAVSVTLEDLVRQEHTQGSLEGTKCLVRLVRGLAFTCLALQTTQDEPTLALHVCFRRAYDVVLRHHHTFVVRSVVTLAIRAVPRRDQFYTQISQGGDRDKFAAELRRWLVGLDVIVQRMKAFLAEGGVMGGCDLRPVTILFYFHMPFDGIELPKLIPTRFIYTSGCSAALLGYLGENSDSCILSRPTVLFV